MITSAKDPSSKYSVTSAKGSKDAPINRIMLGCLKWLVEVTDYIKQLPENFKLSFEVGNFHPFK